MAVKKSISGVKTALFVAIAGGAVFAGVSLYVRNSPQVAPREPAAQAVPKPEVKQGKSVEVLTPSYSANGELVLRSKAHPVAEGDDVRVAAVNAFLRQIPAVPKSAVARSVVVRDGTATIDFNPDIVAGYGTEDERTLVEGVLATMSQFEGVRRVMFTAGGKPIDSFGNLDISGPQVVPSTKSSGP